MNQVTIVRVSDGVVRVYQCDSPWVPSDETGSGSIWWWTEGNGSCDCNRATFFARAGGEVGTSDFPEDLDCGDERYRIPFITLEDGSRIVVDAEFGPENAQPSSASSAS